MWAWEAGKGWRSWVGRKEARAAQPPTGRRTVHTASPHSPGCGHLSWSLRKVAIVQWLLQDLPHLC